MQRWDWNSSNLIPRSNKGLKEWGQIGKASSVVPNILIQKIPSQPQNKETVYFSKCCLIEKDRLYGLVVRVPGYRTEMYCVSCDVRTEFILCYVEESRPPLWSSGQSSWLQNGDVLFFLWGTNWIYICYAEESDSLCGLVVRVLGYRSGVPGSIPATTRKKKVVGLERGPLSLVSTTEELLDRSVAAPV
jgi:hypothetical protein